ncbi:efflux RND transporter permease subunit [Pistricoccus aurantiacus]|uniref:Efflux RND transporter permease subunit n=1 Tax=Pistricoccus aurantiacus TaxID=1883414 RepID=A0A5B8SXH3_9GAMM|nr:efflux RND transporter permease subunit [Pistricoccus aurantiacus]QEA39508.1 efflux RND transporter permease subunit [Pistricoccus aurantiacus]
MKFADWAVSHRRGILFLAFAIAMAGIAAALTVPVGLFPKVSFPRIEASLDAGDRPAKQMVLQVTRVAEKAVRSIPGVVGVRSTTSRGTADVSVNMAWGTDTRIAALEVESALTGALPSMPPGTAVSVRRMDPTVFPVAGYALTSDQTDQIALRLYVRDQLVPALSAINGVADVTIGGGDIGEFEVEVSDEQMVQAGVVIGDVSNALAASNVLQAVGRIEDLHKLYLVVTDDRLKTMDDIKKTIIRAGPSGTITLDDIATVREAAAPNWTIVTSNGKPAVLFQVYQQPGSNTVQIVKDVKSKLETLKAGLPAGTQMRNWYDQSDLILASAASVRDAILIGVGLAALVLLFFLRNIKVTLIALIAVPAALASSILILKIFGRSFNIMTLGGMAAAIGLVIDDAIVMIEQMVRGLAERKEASHAERARAAAASFFKPFLGSSLATVVIFLPLAFLSGVTGAFFQALSLTMASALIFSFLVGWLAIPLIADKLLTQKDVDREEKRDTKKGLIDRLYTGAIRTLLRAPILALLIVGVFLGGSYLAYKHVGSGFMPHMDEGGFVLDYVAPAGTALTDVDNLLKQVEAILLATPEVDTFSRRTGIQLGGGLTEANAGDFFVKLKPLPRRPIDAVMTEVRDKIGAHVPALDTDTALLMEDLIGDLTSVPQPVEIKVYGDDQAKLTEIAGNVAKAIGGVQGLVSILDGIVLAGDALTITVDRPLAELNGLDPTEVTQQINALLTGDLPTQITQGINVMDVRVRLPATERTTIDDISRFEIRNTNGALVPLSRIAKIERVTGQPELTRENMKQMVAVTARIDGRDMGSAVADVINILKSDASLIPAPYTWEIGGLYKEQQASFRGLMTVFGTGIILVFMLVLFLYESFAIAVTLLFVPLIGAGAVFIGLFVTSTELNISALMGLTMILGIMTEVSIFYFSKYQDLCKTGMERFEALVQAGQARFRPILMTTVAAILALIPLALAIGQGSAMQQPLAIAIISGLIVQMPLVLIVIPSVYRILGRIPKPGKVNDA